MSSGGGRVESRIAMAALDVIAEFGEKNPGCGFTCAKMARAALAEADKTQVETSVEDPNAPRANPFGGMRP